MPLILRRGYHDPGPDGGFHPSPDDLVRYIDWLEAELVLVRAALAHMREVEKRRGAGPKSKPEKK